MNRQQRRKTGQVDMLPMQPKFQAPLTKDQIIAIAMVELEKEKKFIMNESFKRAVRDLTAAFMLSASDEFGFGEKRLARLLGKVAKTFACINEGTVTIEDIKQWCKEKGFDYDALFEQ